MMLFEEGINDPRIDHKALLRVLDRSFFKSDESYI